MSKHNHQLDESTYESARAYLKDALEQMLAAGRSAREFGDFALDKFGDKFIPYLQEFSQEVSKGKIKIKGLGKPAKTAIFGRHVSRQEREDMIREAAYLRAEQRGFVGGSPEEDWCQAEREVDRRLAQESGLVEKGRMALTSVGTIIEREFDEVRHVVAGWLEGGSGSGPLDEVTLKKKVAVKQTAPAKAGTAASTAEAGKAAKEAKKKSAGLKKAAKKKAVKKKRVAAKKRAKKATAKSD